MKKLFNFKYNICYIYDDNYILIRDLTDGKILISENPQLSIYLLKKEGNAKFELIQKIFLDNYSKIKISIDGITKNLLIIEYSKGFEKKTDLLVKKVEFSNKKEIFIKGLFINDNSLIIYYKNDYILKFEEIDMNGNCQDIKKYSHNLLNWIDEFEKNSKFIFSWINQNLIFVKDNKININKINIKTLEVEEIKEIKIPNVFQKINKGINCLYSKNKLIYIISCLIYNESEDSEKNIVKLFITD